MATDLRVISTIGIRNSGGAIPGVAPQLDTVLDLNGVRTAARPQSLKIFSVSTTTQYVINRNTTSSFQTITITNDGNSNIKINRLFFDRNGVRPVVLFPPEWIVSRSTLFQQQLAITAAITIEPNQTKTFDLAYSGDTLGEYSNRVAIQSDAPVDPSYYTFFTLQNVTDIFNYTITPTTAITTSTRFYQKTLHNFNINSFNGTTSSFNFNLVGSTGFSIVSTSTTVFSVEFDNEKINNLNGTYTATVQVISGALSQSVSLSHTVQTNAALYQHYNSWSSPASPLNSIIGISYDKILGVKCLTIGIGSGADGSPSTLVGAGSYLLVDNLGIKGAESETPFKYWATVYRIPLLGTARRYYSNDHIVKSIDTSYDAYFGENRAPASIFIVDDDGFGNLSIKINRLRILSDDDNLNVTLKAISRAFYYYVPASVESRYYQLSTTPLAPPAGDGSVTEMFGGFYNDGSIVTYIVPYPTI